MSSRILVVDDTPDNIQPLAGTLMDKGYQISVATNGRRALVNHFEGSRPTAFCLRWLVRFHGSARGTIPPVRRAANVARSTAPMILL
jgi:DNA-binding response OmpR family regulator